MLQIDNNGSSSEGVVLQLMKEAGGGGSTAADLKTKICQQLRNICHNILGKFLTPPGSAASDEEREIYKGKTRKLYNQIYYHVKTQVEKNWLPVINRLVVGSSETTTTESSLLLRADRQGRHKPARRMDVESKTAESDSSSDEEDDEQTLFEEYQKTWINKNTYKTKTYNGNGRGWNGKGWECTLKPFTSCVKERADKVFSLALHVYNLDINRTPKP